jgi:hypothetical protein
MSEVSDAVLGQKFPRRVRILVDRYARRHDAPAVHVFAEPFQAGHFSAAGRTPSHPHIKYQLLATKCLNGCIDIWIYEYRPSLLAQVPGRTSRPPAYHRHRAGQAGRSFPLGDMPGLRFGRIQNTKKPSSSFGNIVTIFQVSVGARDENDQVYRPGLRNLKKSTSHPNCCVAEKIS